MTYSWTDPVPTIPTAPTATMLNNLANNLAFMHQEYPQRCDVWHRNSTVVNGGAILRLPTSGQIFNHVAYQGTPVDADQFEQSVVLVAGTYTVTWLGATRTNGGLIDWDIDGVTIKLAQDWGMTNVANVEKSVSSVVIGSTGRHVLTGTVNGTNSAGYEIRLTVISFIPESDTP